MAAVRRGDAHAFALLWQRTNPGLRRYLRVVSRDRVDLVAAATWRALVPALPRFRGSEAQWRTRVFATARRESERSGGTAPVPAPVPLGRRGLDDVMTGLALDLLAGLEPSEREVLVLRTAGRLSVAQIAEITNLNHPSVRTTARNALARASILASDPVIRRRIDRAAPPLEGDVHERASLPGPMPSETVLEDVLAGQPAGPGAGPRTRLMAALVAALAAPPTLEEVRGAGPPYTAFRRQFATAPPHRRLTVRLGSRVAVAAGVAGIAMSGTLAAAYSGALPSQLQDVAHDWLNAPPADGGDHHPPAPATTSTRNGHRRGGGPTATGSAAGSRPGHAGAGPTAHPTAGHNTPPGSTTSHPAPQQTPPGASSTPSAGSHTPPGSTRTPPTGTKTPPGSTKTPPKGGTTSAGATKTKTPPTSTRTRTQPRSRRSGP